MTHFPLALAACSALVVSSAYCQGLHTYIIEEGVTLPSGDQLRAIDRFLPNAGGSGWAALFTVDPGARREIWADFVDDGASVPQRLFSLPLGANDFVQNLRFQDVRNDSVIWEMHQGAGGMTLETGVWIDGVWEPQASGPGPITGSTWIGTPRLQRTTSGSLVAFGELEVPNSPPARLVMELGASAPLLMERDTITGTNVQLFLSYAAAIPRSLDISPNGEHVIAVVSGSDQRQWLVLDRAPLALHGATLFDGNPAPQEVLDALGVSTAWFERFSSVDVQDSGDWTAVAVIGMPLSQYEDVAIRNGRLIETGSQRAGVVTMVKGATAVVGSLEQLYTDYAVLSRQGDPVDLDGDGAADPGWEVSLFGHPFAANGAGAVYLGMQLESAAGEIRSGWGKLADRMPDLMVCPGVPNSSGLVGHLSAVGTSELAANDLTLIAHGLPVNAAGYALVSAERGLVVQPGGSQGNLCLKGAIGRYTSSVIQSGSLGAGPTSIDLSTIPQPLGSVLGTAGQTWFFQLWYRDQVGGTTTSNFTDAIAILVR